MPLKLWSLCNLISSALEPLQSKESLKAVPEVEQESEREDTQAGNISEQRRVLLRRAVGMLFQRNSVH